MPKSWAEKARGAKPAHVVVLDKPFAGTPAGASLFITSPPVIEDYMRAVPKGETRSMGTMRADLAAREKADAACPVTSSIHARIVSEIAIEAMQAGAPPQAVTPFWRVVEPRSELAKKLSIGPAGVEKLRAAEGSS
jgi:hypothetical protein